MNHSMVELINRTDKDFKFMFDAIQYVVPANGLLGVTADCATHGRKKSIMAYDLETGRATYQLGIKGQNPITSLGAGKESTDELIDRDTDVAGTPVKINVRGAQIVPDREDALTS